MLIYDYLVIYLSHFISGTICIMRKAAWERIQHLTFHTNIWDLMKLSKFLVVQFSPGKMYIFSFNLCMKMHCLCAVKKQDKEMHG